MASDGEPTPQRGFPGWYVISLVLALLLLTAIGIIVRPHIPGDAIFAFVMGLLVIMFVSSFTIAGNKLLVGRGTVLLPSQALAALRAIHPTLLTASGIGITLAINALKSSPAAPWLVQTALFGLVACIVFSLGAFILFSSFVGDGEGQVKLEKGLALQWAIFFLIAIIAFAVGVLAASVAIAFPPPPTPAPSGS